MAIKLPPYIEDSGIGSDVALMKDIYEVLNEAEQQRQESTISHATRYLVELLTQQVEEVVPWECESAVCQSAYRLLEAVEDWHNISDTDATVVSAEPEAVREVLLTVHGNLTKLLARGPAKTNVYRALPQRGHQDERPCQASDFTWLYRSLSEQGQQDESGLLSGDPWEGCDDIAAEDLFEWFAESLTQPAPAEASPVPVISSSIPLRVLHRDLLHVLREPMEEVLLERKLLPAEDAKLEGKDRPSCSGRISTVSTAASLGGLGRSCDVGSLTPSISSASSTGTGPSEGRLASLSVGSHMMSLRRRPSLASSRDLLAKRLLATSPLLQPRPKTRAIPSSPCMNSRDLQVMPTLSEMAADELKQCKLIHKLELGDRESREPPEHSTLEVYEAFLDDWEEEFLRRAPLDDWEDEFLRRAAHG